MRLQSIALAVLLISGGGCATSRASTGASTPAAQTTMADRLYFGRSIPGGGTVSDDDWNAFLRDVVTPRFPSGLTVWRAQGQWRDKSGVIVREDSFVLELMHAGSAEAEASIRAIIEEYKRRFRQEAVLRVRDRVEMQLSLAAHL